MQHTLISPQRLTFWAILVFAQAALAVLVRRRDFAYLRNYLRFETAISGTLWIMSRTLPAWPYFYAWCVGEVLDQLAAAYLLYSIAVRIRRRASADRSGPAVLIAAAFVALVAGISTSGVARSLLAPSWQLVLSWDNAFWAAACLFVAFLPLYTWYGYSTMRGFRVVFASFAVYIVAHAGLFDLLIIKGREAGLVWTSDGIYAACICSWYFASRDRKAAVAAD